MSKSGYGMARDQMKNFKQMNKSAITPDKTPEYRRMGSFSAVAVLIGMVIGVGIFRLPSIVAGHAANEADFILFWIAGGIIAFSGSLCYAALSMRMPDSGGEYTFLRRSIGPSTAYLFAWGRVSVIQTGSLALVALIFGDYATSIANLGANSNTIYAALLVIVLTVINMSGTRQSSKIQNLLAALVIGALITLCLTALFHNSGEGHNGVLLTPGQVTDWSVSMPGLAMIFVLLTFGGWNEAAYLTGELRNARQTIGRVLTGSVILITLLYVGINLAYIHIMGLDGLRNSAAPGQELSEALFGQLGSAVIVSIIIIAAISTANATIITGSRSLFALGRDYPEFRLVGKWNERRDTPGHALAVQGFVALILLAAGTLSSDNLSAVVDFTAPVFWFFILMVIIGLFKLQYQNSEAGYKQNIPLYPLPALLFLAACIYMLYSSLTYTGTGALFGVIVLLLGFVLKKGLYFFAADKT